MNDPTNTPFARFQEAARPDPDRPLDTKEHKCAIFGPQAHFVRDNPDGSQDLFAAPCMRWPCDACCTEVLRPRLRKGLSHAVHQHGLTLWVTLTLVQNGPPDPPRYAKRLSTEWKALRDLYRKRFGHALRYAWLKELQNDRPHLHLFMQPTIDEHWLKVTWHSLTGAHQVKIVRLETDEEIAHRVNYATKNICQNAATYGTTCGRWRGTSKGIQLQVRPRTPGGSGCHRAAYPIDLTMYADRPHRVLWMDRGGRPKRVRIEPPGEHQHAP